MSKMLPRHVAVRNICKLVVSHMYVSAAPGRSTFTEYRPALQARAYRVTLPLRFQVRLACRTLAQVAGTYIAAQLVLCCRRAIECTLSGVG